MKLAIIAAYSVNRVIGYRKVIPWHLPADLKRFKNFTMGHHLLMGRKTFESIGRPLPGRTTVVITRRHDWTSEGVLVAHSVGAALKIARADEEPFIAGGEEIYRQTLELSSRLYLTLVHEKFKGDTFFPEFNVSSWQLLSREDWNANETNPYAYSFLIYERQPHPRSQII